MYYDDERDPVSFLAGIVLGALIGAGIALLAAPTSGRRTRKRIARGAEDLADATSDRFRDVSDDVRRAAEDAARVASRSTTAIADGVRTGVDRGRRRLRS